MQMKGDGLGKEWNDSTGAGHAAASIRGRVIVQIWRAVKERNTVMPQSLSRAVKEILGMRFPEPPRERRSELWAKGGDCLASELRRKAEAALAVMEEADVLGIAAETARLTCTSFDQALPGIRGSQHR